jgi:pantothenate kinase
MPQILVDPVKHLLEFLDGKSPRTIIGVAGLPGAGKSTITQKWERTLNRIVEPNTMKVLGMDGFHLTKAELSKMANPKAALARRGAPWTFDVHGFISKIGELKSTPHQKSVYWPSFEHNIGDPVDGAIEVLPSCRLILVEGLYVLFRKGDWQLLNGYFDETWYLNTPIDTSMSRLIERHQQTLQLSKRDAENKVKMNDYKNALIVLSTRDQSDWIIPMENWDK